MDAYDHAIVRALQADGRISNVELAERINLSESATLRRVRGLEEVELIESNPEYAYVRHPDGRESTVSLRHLAPCGQPALNQSNTPGNDNSIEQRTPAPEPAEAPVSLGETIGERIPTQELRDEPVTERSPEPERVLRRSERIRRPPDRLKM